MPEPTTTDPRARLAEIKQAVATERTLIDGDPFYEVQGYLPDGTPLHECSRWEHVGLSVADAMAAALTAVLDLLDDPGGPDSWSHTFQGRHAVFADDVSAAITEKLGGDRG